MHSSSEDDDMESPFPNDLSLQQVRKQHDTSHHLFIAFIKKYPLSAHYDMTLIKCRLFDLPRPSPTIRSNRWPPTLWISSASMTRSSASTMKISSERGNLCIQHLPLQQYLIWCILYGFNTAAGVLFFVVRMFIFSFFSLLSATFDRIAEINFNLDADDNSVSVKKITAHSLLWLSVIIMLQLQFSLRDLRWDTPGE